MDYNSAVDMRIDYCILFAYALSYVMHAHGIWESFGNKIPSIIVSYTRLVSDF